MSLAIHMYTQSSNLIYVVLLQPEVSSMVSLHSASQTSKRARAALIGDIVPDAMLSRLTLPDDANPAGLYLHFRIDGRRSDF